MSRPNKVDSMTEAEIGLPEVLGVEFRSASPYGYHGIAAGSDGSIWSCRRGSWRRLNLCGCDRGFLQTGLSYGDKQRHVYAHVIACSCFHGHRPSSVTQVRHLDGDRTNNRVGNICWGTPQQAKQDRLRNGGHVIKLTPADIREIKALDPGKGNRRGGWMKQTAERFGVARDTIKDIVAGRRWKNVEAPA